MSITQQALQYGQRRIARKMLRAVPWLGAIVAIATLGVSIRRKGAIGGSVDTLLDFIPFVSGLKNTAEIVRGRDFIPEKRPRGAEVQFPPSAAKRHGHGPLSAL